MIAARNMPPRWAYENKQGEVKSFPQRPVCSFCGEEAVFFANVAKRLWAYSDYEMYACWVCKESLKEVAIKSHMSPKGPMWGAGTEELWYKMPKEQVYKHPAYLKWQGC